MLTLGREELGSEGSCCWGCSMDTEIRGGLRVHRARAFAETLARETARENGLSPGTRERLRR